MNCCLLKVLSNIPGWFTKRKLIVFESDDWGTIRTCDLNALERLVEAGIDFNSHDAGRYSNNDALESSDDLSALFEVLSSYKDQYGHSAIFTSLSLVANPDFERIRANGFTKYIYEPFIETLKRYPECAGSFTLWKQGIRDRIFIPQFHGREHLNVVAWMNALRGGHQETHKVFNEGMWGYVNSYYGPGRINYMEAFNFYGMEELDYLREVIRDGLNVFYNLLGYRASYFVAPNGPFPNALEKDLAANGISYIGQSKVQHEPVGNGKTKKVLHYLGQQNSHGQIYLTRNCSFEPSRRENTDWVSSCLKEIEIAFKCHKPATISTHRVNYIGRLNPSNRESSLKQLKDLLTNILKRWPDAEFISSDKLGAIINESKRA